MKKSQYLVLFAVIITVVNFATLQQWRISHLSNQLELSDMRAKVNAEFADELFWLQVNDVEQLSKDNLIAHGKLQGMVDYYAQDENTRKARYIIPYKENYVCVGKNLHLLPENLIEYEFATQAGLISQTF